LENHWKIIGKSLVSIGKSIVHWKIIGKSIEMMENPWFSIENPLKNPWFTKASLRGGSGVVPPNRFDATHLPRAFESLGRVHATGSGTACGSCGLVHVFFSEIGCSSVHHQVHCFPMCFFCIKIRES
jgi:hypothetical protein